MNDTELDKMLETWEAPEPSPALREAVRLAVPAKSHRRSYGWAAAAASVVATASLLGVAMLGKGQAQLADGTLIQSSMQVEPASARERYQKLGLAFSTGGNRQQGFCYNEATRTYTGYDLTVQPQGDGTYLMTVQPVSKPFRQVGDSADAAQYRETPLPAIPAARVVKEGEAFDIDLMRDPQTGDRVFERVELSHNSADGLLQHIAHTVHGRHLRFALWLHSMLGVTDGRLHLNSPKLYIDGAMAVEEPGSAVNGHGVFFYLPDRGRYVMTLDAAGDSRFVRAGTVKGATLDFALDGIRYRVESQEPIAGGGEHPVYVFHEQSYRVNPEVPELNRPHFAAGRPDRAP